MYQSIIYSPKNIEKIAPKARNGPKGMGSFIVFFPIAMRKSPTIAPLKKESRIAKMVSLKPRNKPIAPANFTSPKPMPFGKRRYKMKNNPKPTNNPIKYCAKLKMLNFRLARPIIKSKRTNIFGMIKYFKSYIKIATIIPRKPSIKK